MKGLQQPQCVRPSTGRLVPGQAYHTGGILLGRRTKTLVLPHAPGRRVCGMAQTETTGGGMIYQSTAYSLDMQPTLSMPVDSSSITAAGLLVDEIRSLPCNQVADTLWGYVLSRGYDPSVFAAVASVACEDMDRYSADALISILSATAQVGHVDRPFVVAAAEKLAQPYGLADVSPGSLSQGIWALAMLAEHGVVQYEQETHVQDAVAAVARHAARKVGEFGGDELARLLAGLAQLCAPPVASLIEGVSSRLQSSLIPMAQLSPEQLAQIVWAYARWDVYDRAVFDAVQVELQRKAGELGLEALANAAWAYASVRDQDAKHRAVHDIHMLRAFAARCTVLLESSRSTNGGTATAPSQGKDSPSNSTGALDTTDTANEQAGESSVLTKHLLTVLLAYANLSHHDKDMFNWAAKHLTGQLHLCRGQDLVVCAFVYSRMKHSAPQLVHAMGTALPAVASELACEDCVYLAMLGPTTGVYSEALMKTALQQALDLTSQQDPAAVDTASLLDLARCVAAVASHDAAYYDDAQHSLLRAVNAAQLAADLESMSTHCGATSPSGLQK